MWYLLQNTEATALTAKHQTDFALRQLNCKQHGEHRTARYPVTVSFWETIYSSYNICSNSHFLPGVLAPLCDNSIFNCEQIELANCASAMLQLVNSTHRKPRAQSPSIGIIMQRTLLIASADCNNVYRSHSLSRHVRRVAQLKGAVPISGEARSVERLDHSVGGTPRGPWIETTLC